MGDDNDKPDVPIAAQTFDGAPNVVSIGDLRVSRGFSRRPMSACKHLALTYDSQERRVWCKECEHTVEAFDAFKILAEYFEDAWYSLQRRAKKIEEAEGHSLISRAAKNVDDVWRRQKMAPCCRACGNGLLPEDFADGVGASVGRDYERARRQRKTTP